MKSNICELSKDLSCLANTLNEIEKAASYNDLSYKNTLRLRLLAEELCGMLPGLLEHFGGVFWVENDGSAYELHVELQTSGMNADVRETLIALSSSGKNAAAKGIMGKIRNVVEIMLLNEERTAAAMAPMNVGWGGYSMGFLFVDPSLACTPAMNAYTWSLAQYRIAAEAKQDEDAVEELERSIVAKLADDTVVGIRGQNVEIVVKKRF